MNVPAQRPVPGRRTDRRFKLIVVKKSLLPPLKNIRVRFEKLRISLPEERRPA